MKLEEGAWDSCSVKPEACSRQAQVCEAKQGWICRHLAFVRAALFGKHLRRNFTVEQSLSIDVDWLPSNASAVAWQDRLPNRDGRPAEARSLTWLMPWDSGSILILTFARSEGGGVTSGVLSSIFMLGAGTCSGAGSAAGTCSHSGMGSELQQAKPGYYNTLSTRMPN